MFLRKMSLSVALVIVVSIHAVADVNGNGAGLVLSTTDNWAGASGVNGNGAYLITMGTVEAAETIGNGRGAMLTLNPPYALISKGPTPPELCEQFPLDGALTNFYAAFGIADDGLVDLVGLGLPVDFAIGLVEYACENDADYAAAASNAFLLNRSMLQPFVEADNALKGHVKVFSILGLLSNEMDAVLIQMLESAGVDVAGLVLTAVICDEIGCLPASARSDASRYEVWDPVSKQETNEPFAATGDYDGDGISNLDEATNVLGHSDSTADFVVAAVNADLDGTEAPNAGCGAGGNAQNQDADAPAFLALLLLIAALVISRRRAAC